jgi:hypothetical protein
MPFSINFFNFEEAKYQFFNNIKFHLFSFNSLQSAAEVAKRPGEITADPMSHYYHTKLVVRGRSLEHPQNRSNSRPEHYHDTSVRGTKKNPPW